MSSRVILLLGSILGCLLPPIASAQTDPRVRVTGSVGGLFGDGGPAASVAGSVDVRLQRYVGVEFEVATARGLDFGEFDGPRILGEVARLPTATLAPVIFPPIRIETGGRLVSFVTSLVAAFPALGGRVRPFVLGGGGVAHVRRQLEFIVPATNRILGPARELTVIPVPSASRFGETSLALKLGAGVDFAVQRRLSLGVEVRYAHLFGEQNDLDVTRAAGRVGWGF